MQEDSILDIISKFINANLSEIITAFSTLFAAFFGAWFAFHLQNKYEKKKLLDTRITNINITQVLLYQQFSNLLVLKRDFVSPNVDDNYYFINIPAFSKRDIPSELNISSIAFLIDIGYQHLITEIILAYEKYIECLKAINMRSEFRINIFQPKMEEIRKENRNGISIEMQIELLGPEIVYELESMTDQIKESLNDGILTYEHVINEVNRIGISVFPKAKILNARIN